MRRARRRPGRGGPTWSLPVALFVRGSRAGGVAAPVGWHLVLALRVEVLDGGAHVLERARLRGGPNAADSRAVGPVESVNRPLLSVLGLTFDTTAAVAYEDPAGNPIDADTFFLGALPGAIVEQNGAWDGVGTLSGGVVALIMGVDPPPPADPLRSLIVGTFRGGDRLFENGFD